MDRRLWTKGKLKYCRLAALGFQVGRIELFSIGFKAWAIEHSAAEFKQVSRPIHYNFEGLNLLPTDAYDPSYWLTPNADMLKLLANSREFAQDGSPTNLPQATQEAIDNRYAICQTCPLFNGRLCTHSSCGCNVNSEQKFLNKLAWADQKCPVGRW